MQPYWLTVTNPSAYQDIKLISAVESYILHALEVKFNYKLCLWIVTQFGDAFYDADAAVTKPLSFHDKFLQLGPSSQHFLPP